MLRMERDPSEFASIVERIEALTKEPGFIYTLALILTRDLFYSPEDAADIDWHEHLNLQELTFLVGLFAKHEIDFTMPTEEASAERFERVYQLFLELHKKHGEQFVKNLAANFPLKQPGQNKEQTYRKTFGAGTMMTEPIFYSGSGAYDFQYLDFATTKYQKDSAWIVAHIGIDVPLMARIARELKKNHERKFAELPRVDRGNFPELCNTALSVFCFTAEDINQFATDRATVFLDAFSLIPGKTNSNLQLPGQYNELQSHPFIRLSDGRYFLPIGFNLSEAIYEDPFYWMNKDKPYAAEALRHRGDFAQSVTAELLQSVFGESNV